MVLPAGPSGEFLPCRAFPAPAFREPTVTEPSLGLSSSDQLETRIAGVGRDLGDVLNALLDALPEGRSGPQLLSRSLGIDKVLASRLVKAARSRDALAVAYHVPGPEPLRRFLRSARRRGAPAALVARAEGVVVDFEALVRHEVGDRSALDAMISAWLPEAREVFEVRRKQSAYKALSQLKGVSAEVNLSTVLLYPSEDGKNLDLVWVVGLLGLRRLRAGVPVKLTSRRMPGESNDRRPETLDGQPIEDLDGLRLDQFCDAPPASVQVRRVGDTMQYLLGGDDFGPRSAVDLILAEVNHAEMSRFVPAGSGRKGYVFAEVGTPCKALLFDVLVHEDVYPGAVPSLCIYDTALDGVASVNDPIRDIDRIEMSEALLPLGQGTSSLRSPDVPHYADLIRHVFQRTGWKGEQFRSYRCRIDYPLYGSQVVAVFQPPER
jgi:hypothetical protein